MANALTPAAEDNMSHQDSHAKATRALPSEDKGEPSSVPFI